MISNNRCYKELYQLYLTIKPKKINRLHNEAVCILLLRSLSGLVAE
jgi:hypothetical protein